MRLIGNTISLAALGFSIPQSERYCDVPGRATAVGPASGAHAITQFDADREVVRDGSELSTIEFWFPSPLTSAITTSVVPGFGRFCAEPAVDHELSLMIPDEVHHFDIQTGGRRPVDIAYVT